MALDLKRYVIGATPTIEGGELRYIQTELKKIRDVLDAYKAALEAHEATINP